MVDERESPSAGWREVYHEMEADPDAEEATHPCPDCGRTCENLLRDAYECEEHGVFRASAGDNGESVAEDARETVADDTGKTVTDDSEETVTDETAAEDAPDDPDKVENRAREPAD